MARPCQHPRGPAHPNECAVCWHYVNSPGFKELYDAMPGEPLGLGDVVETVLSSVGITPQRVQKTIGGACNCNNRKASLNKLGNNIKDAAAHVFSGIKSFVGS